jgi:hypothetical protein
VLLLLIGHLLGDGLRFVFVLHGFHAFEFDFLLLPLLLFQLLVEHADDFVTVDALVGFVLYYLQLLLLLDLLVVAVVLDVGIEGVDGEEAGEERHLFERGLWVELAVGFGRHIQIFLAHTSDIYIVYGYKIELAGSWSTFAYV